MRSSAPRRTDGFAPREMYDAECNKCHGRCQVPFRPNGKKPVYCGNCFVKDGERTERPRERTQRPPARAVPEVSARQIEDLKRQIEAMNQTLERLVTVVDTFNRATALTQEIRKHFPVAEAAPSKKAAAPKKKAA